MGASYGQFCPVSKAMEVLDERWTLLVVRELLFGSTRFNEIRRGVPRMSQTLLTKRLLQHGAASEQWKQALDQMWDQFRQKYGVYLRALDEDGGGVAAGRG